MMKKDAGKDQMQYATLKLSDIAMDIDILNIEDSTSRFWCRLLAHL